MIMIIMIMIRMIMYELLFLVSILMRECRYLENVLVSIFVDINDENDMNDDSSSNW